MASIPSARPAAPGTHLDDPETSGDHAGPTPVAEPPADLGPAETWPAALRVQWRMLRASPSPLLLCWGADHLLLYNEALRPWLGVRHPEALGRPAHSAWPELWRALESSIAAVLRGGGTVWRDDLPWAVERRGRLTEAHFALALTPVADDQSPSGIGGVLAQVREITVAVIGTRRAGLLRDLAPAVAAASAGEACRCAAAVLARDPWDLPFALIYLRAEEGAGFRLAAATPEGLSADFAPPAIAPDATGRAWPPPPGEADDAPRIVARAATPGVAWPAGPWPEPPAAAVAVPIPATAEDPAGGFLVAGASARLDLDDAHLDFFRAIAARLGHALDAAERRREERRRAAALADLDRARTAFFSNASHEFRTPLSLILGPLEDLLDRPGTPWPAEDRELLAMAQRNGQRLLKLVNSLLDFSRVEAGHVQPRFEPLDLAAATAELAGAFRAVVEKAGLGFHVHCPRLPEPVHADRDMWERIVLNLLSNAFKYTLRGEIRVSLRPDGGEAVLEVADTGGGIPEAELPKLFNRFHRVEGTPGRTQEGTGIGLALVQELARLHGGRVAVASRVGAGSRFRVAIPLGRRLAAGGEDAVQPPRHRPRAAAPFVEEALRWLPGAPSDRAMLFGGTAGPASATGREAPEGRRPLIVVADDNADLRDSLLRLLQGDYDVIAAADGQEALQVAMDLKPDLLLAEAALPNLNGSALLKALRADPGTRAIPVMLLSARAGEEARSAVLAAGADDYLAKPFGARELLARTAAALTLARTRRGARRDAEALRAETLTILENIDEGFFILDREFRFAYVNAAAEGLLGRRRERLLGRGHFLLFPETLGGPLETAYRRARAGRIMVRVELASAWERRLAVKVCPAERDCLAVYLRELGAALPDRR